VKVDEENIVKVNEQK